MPPEIREPAPAAEPVPSASAAAEPEERPPWEGPFLGVTRSSAGIYASPKFDREQKIGYAQEGAKVPVRPDAVAGEGCSEGWLEVVDGGYICKNHGTTNLEDPRVKFGPSQPQFDQILPYRYARNTKNGTPLYRSVPSREQLERYEPQLFAKPAATGTGTPAAAPSTKPPLDAATLAAKEDQERRMAALRAARRAMLGEAADDAEPAKETEQTLARVEPVLGAAPSAAPEPTAPDMQWWQQDDPELHKLSISDLSAGGDDVLASRLVKGFYVAVDKVFDWNKRRWLKSTKGFVTPADAFHFASGSEFRGVELGAEVKLPVGFVYGPKARSAYRLAEDDKTLSPARKLERFSAVHLSGQERELLGKTYVETVEGDWVRKSELRIAQAAPPPAEVGPDEVWIDVNLTTQTVVASRGAAPFFATLISSGKQHKDPEKDHRTPTGMWRIREKHITATMDGDGSAAGDLPYSIEGVPYVMYFHKAYALHGAFWHRNYGVQMSHGCINLAPLDAKFLFEHSGPDVAEGWHGSWSSEGRLGSLVVVHD